MIHFLFLLMGPLVSANPELQQAYQREFTFLVSQKEALVRQRKDLEANANQSTRELEAKLRSKERELAQLQSSNENVFDLVQSLEKRKREEQNLESALTNLWNRADREIKEKKHALTFQSEKIEIQSLPPKDLRENDVHLLGKEALAILKQANTTEEFSGVYRNTDRNLE